MPGVVILGSVAYGDMIDMASVLRLCVAHDALNNISVSIIN